MPCDMMSGVDWGSVAHSELQTVKKALSQTQAMLCGIMSALEKVGALEAILANYNATQSGVSKDQLQAWFESHKKEDDNK